MTKRWQLGGSGLRVAMECEMKRLLLGACLALSILAGCTENSVEPPRRLDQTADLQQCRRAVDYQSGTFALGNLKAKLTFDAGYRITEIDALPLNTPALHEAGDEIAVHDGFQHNFCLAMNLTQGDTAKHDGFQQRMLAARRRVTCLMTKIQALGARISSEDVEECLART